MPVDAQGNQVVTLGGRVAGENQGSDRLEISIRDASGNNNLGGVDTAGNVKVASGVAAEAVLANAITIPTGASGQFWNTASVAMPARNKVLWIVVNTAIVFASAQPSIRPFATRAAIIAGNGSSSALPISAAYIASAALTITSAAQTTIPVNTVYRISSSFASFSVTNPAGVALGATTGIAELDRADSFIGVEFNWGAAPSAGVISLYVEAA